MKYGIYFFLPLLTSLLFGDVNEYSNITDGDQMTDPPRQQIAIPDKDDEDLTPPPETPIVLTGPLLTPSATSIPPGHVNIEPYIYFNDTIGFYHNHFHLHRFPQPLESINIQIPTQIGLNSFMDLYLSPQFFFNYVGDEDSWKFGDFDLGLDIQLVWEDNKRGIPAIKFFYDITLPTGSYQNLKLNKLNTDSSGGGSFVSTFGLVTSYLWRFKDPYSLSFRMSTFYSVPTNVTVHGINSYGGDISTDGRVFPGDVAHLVLGLEYTITKCWALALDVANTAALKTRFEGTTIAPVGNNDVTYVLSLAPAIEYNYSAAIGLIGGVWFSVYGINGFDFINGVIALNIYI